MDIVKIFGTNLRKIRTEKGYSQEKFAELCGLHRTYISDIDVPETASGGKCKITTDTGDIKIIIADE